MRRKITQSIKILAKIPLNLFFSLFQLPWNSNFTSGQRREFIAKLYLKGNGIEIGALHQPLPVSILAHVKYIDQFPVFELRKHYPELSGFSLVNLDIIDNAEKLEKIEDATQDFVIASHLIEHCEDPIGAFINWMRVLKKDGVIYLAIPDKRFTFDKNRPVTSIEHLIRDYKEGPAWSRRQHYEEWVTKISENGVQDVEKEINSLIDTGYSIHFHVWTQAEMFELLTTLHRDFKIDFDVLVSFQNKKEVIFILKKN